MARTRNNIAAAFAATALFAGLSASPALAFNGRDALALCLQQGAAQCAVATQPDGAIRIATREGIALSCANANAPCTMLYAPRATHLAQAPAPPATR